RPGSRRCTCMSISPGVTMKPAASMLGVPSGAPSPLPISSTTPSAISTSMISSIPWLGSITRPPFINRFISDTSYHKVKVKVEVKVKILGLLRRGRAAAHVVEHGHPDGDPVFHLLQDVGLRAVGHRGGEFHAAVDRTRMHHHGVLLGQ